MGPRSLPEVRSIRIIVRPCWAAALVEQIPSVSGGPSDQRAPLCGAN